MSLNAKPAGQASELLSASSSHTGLLGLDDMGGGEARGGVVLAEMPADGSRSGRIAWNPAEMRDRPLGESNTKSSGEADVFSEGASWVASKPTSDGSYLRGVDRGMNALPHTPLLNRGKLQRSLPVNRQTAMEPGIDLQAMDSCNLDLQLVIKSKYDGPAAITGFKFDADTIDSGIDMSLQDLKCFLR